MDWGKKEKERIQAERQEPQGFKVKILIVENFFGLQGQEQEKRNKRTRKSPELVGTYQSILWVLNSADCLFNV